MSKYVQSKKRLLSICKLRGKLAQSDYLSAEKNITKLELSREQLGVMAGQMLDTRSCVHSAMLAAKLEFGHRFITLQGLQKAKIVKERKAATMLQSEAFLSGRREERAQQDFRQAKKSNENRLQQCQPQQSKHSGFGNGKSTKGMKA